MSKAFGAIFHRRVMPGVALARTKTTGQTGPRGRLCLFARALQYLVGDGLNDPLRSRGTVICTGPTLGSTVLERLPVHELPRPLQDVLQQTLGQLLQQPIAGELGP